MGILWIQYKKCSGICTRVYTYTNVSVNSKPDHPPGTLLEFSKGRIPHPLAQRNLVLKPHPRGNYFQKSSKNTKHDTEIMKNSTEMLMYLELLKQW